MAKPLLPDALWELIEPLLPAPKPRRFRHPGRNRVGDREALTGILFVLKTGITWAELPREMGCGCGMTCWRRLRAWHAAGVWFTLHQLLLARLDAAGKIDWDRAAVDASFARARGGVDGSGPNPTDRGRPGVKHHVLVDAAGVPLAGEVTGANVPDAAGTLPLLDSAGPVDPTGGAAGPGGRPGELYGDRAYDAEALRDAVREREVEPKLAKRRTPHGSGLGVYRWVVERTLGWLHNFKRLRVVTEKTQDMQLALLNLGMSLICFNYWCSS